MFEPKVFWEQMHCIEGSTYDIVWTFRSQVIRRPQNSTPLVTLLVRTPAALSVTLLTSARREWKEGLALFWCQVLYRLTT